MNNSQTLPTDGNGNPIPVFDSGNRNTQALTLTNVNTVYAQTVPFSKTAETMASLVLDTHVTFTSKLKGFNSNLISVTVAVGGSGVGLSVAVAANGKDITITLANAGSTRAAVKAAIEANVAANKLVSVAIATAGADGAFTASAIAKTYLSGWDAGGKVVYYRAWCASDFFIGKGTSALTDTKTAEVPVTAKSEYYDVVYPGELITAKVTAAASAGAVVYLTPVRRY